ncbi:MAG: serine hydrolase domain-containing protein, partial [Myxococcales bacterium]
MLLGLSARAAEDRRPTEPAQDLAQLQARLTTILIDTHTPGMGVVLADRGGMLWSAGVGLADVAAGKPATPDTLFRIASISKMFVAFAVLNLVEKGRLDLDTPVKEVLPEVAFTNRWEATDPIRVVHLLEHTTGWDEIHPKEFVHDDPRPVTLSEGLALGPDSRVSRWRPGTRYAYCNSGPAVAAAIVEKLTGQRFEDYVKETFFDPMGMPSADYFGVSPRTRTLLAKAYRADGTTPLPYRNFALRPSGALNASAREMGAVLLLLLRRGQSEKGRLLAEKSISRMETARSSYAAQGGLTVAYGLCNGTVYDDRARVWRGHSGATDGARSELYYLPEQGVGFFFALNAGSDRAMGEIGLQLMAYLTKTFPAPRPPPGQSVPADIARAYAGWYVPANPQVEALAFADEILGMTRLTFDGTGLVRRPLVAPPVRALTVDGTRFRALRSSVPNIALANTPEGRVVVWNDSVFVRISSARAWLEIVLLVLLLAAIVSVPLLALAGGVRWIVRRRQKPGVVRATLAIRVLP